MESGLVAVSASYPIAPIGFIPACSMTSSNDLTVLSNESKVSARAIPSPNPSIKPSIRLTFGRGEVGALGGIALSTTVALMGEIENAPSGVSNV